MEGQEPTTPQAGTLPETPTDPAAPESSVDALPDFAKKMIEDLRKENASHRKAKQAAQEAADKAEEARLENERNYQKLAEQRKAKIEELETQVALAADLTNILSQRIQAEIAEWPKEITDMAPQEPVDPRVLQSWVDQARPLVAKLAQAGQTPGNGSRPTPASAGAKTAEAVAKAQREFVRSKF